MTIWWKNVIQKEKKTAYLLQNSLAAYIAVKLWIKPMENAS